MCICWTVLPTFLKDWSLTQGQKAKPDLAEGCYHLVLKIFNLPFITRRNIYTYVYLQEALLFLRVSIMAYLRPSTVRALRLWVRISLGKSALSVTVMSCVGTGLTMGRSPN